MDLQLFSACRSMTMVNLPDRVLTRRAPTSVSRPRDGWSAPAAAAGDVSECSNGFATAARGGDRNPLRGKALRTARADERTRVCPVLSRPVALLWHWFRALPAAQASQQ